MPETARPDQASTALLTYHKAGSTIAGQIVGMIHAHGGMPHVDLALMAGRFGRRSEPFCIEHRGLLSKPGYFFGALRGTYIEKMGGFAGNRLVVHVRDPRDCLTSFYYSEAYSHPLPTPSEAEEAFRARREKALSMGIDEYCLQQANYYVKCCDAIGKIVKDHPEHMRSKYEDMVTKPKAWLRRVCAFAKVELTDELLAKLTPVMAFSVEEEDVMRKRRQVQPGDHLRKLKPETIEKLNHILQRPLRRWGYLPAEPASEGTPA